MYDKSYMDGFGWKTLPNGNLGCYNCGAAAGNPFWYCDTCKSHKDLDITAQELERIDNNGKGIVRARSSKKVN